jgi:hypothetical protein
MNRTSTSKVYFVAVFSVIFADFTRIYIWDSNFRKEKWDDRSSHGKIFVFNDLLYALGGLAGGHRRQRIEILIQSAGSGLQNQFAIGAILEVLFDIARHGRRELSL